MTGWNYPEKESFEKLVDKNKLYPVNVFSINKGIINKMFSKDMITIHDVTFEKLRKIKIDETNIRKILNQKETIINNRA